MNIRMLETLARPSPLRAMSKSMQDDLHVSGPAKSLLPGRKNLIRRVVGLIAAFTMTTIVIGSQLGLADHYAVSAVATMASQTQPPMGREHVAQGAAVRRCSSGNARNAGTECPHFLPLRVWSREGS
jgi:hypothetical protein